MDRKILLLTVLVAIVGSGFAFIAPVAADHGASEKTTTTVQVPDGYKVPLTVYRPLAASTDNRMPVILHSHGWGGSREKADGAFHNYIAAGYGVASFDMRGHGDARSNSEARVHHMAYEISDVRHVITHLATLPWVQLDGSGDPRLGALGGSYGGGYQLLTAAVDDRLDAIAPEITWNSLPQSLAPNGAPKSAWIDALYASGNAQARVHNTIHSGLVQLEATNQFPQGEIPGTINLLEQFTRSSPGSYPTTLNIPTLLIQGMPDTLFNFNQAAANYLQIKATGAPVKLWTHLNGHILNTQGTLGAGQPWPVGLGLQPPKGPDACGDKDATIIAWFNKYLKAQTSTDTGAAACIALDDGTTVTGTDYPLPQAIPTGFPIPGTITLPQAAPGATTQVSVLTATETTTIAGIPRLSGTVELVGTEAIVYFSLLSVSPTGAYRVLDSQVTPMRLGMAYSPLFTIDLGGIGVKLNPNDALVLVASNWNEQFGQNSGRVPGVVTLSGLSLELPVV